jgi:hypothetical protein
MKVTPFCIQIGMKLRCLKAPPQRQNDQSAAITSGILEVRAGTFEQ